MQLFQVKTPNGDLVMNAPLETLRWVLKLQRPAENRLMMETANLENECVLHFNRFPACGYWPVLHIARLPMEIPAPEDIVRGPLTDWQRQRALPVGSSRDLESVELPALLRPQAGGPTRQTDLGELLCDE